MSEHPKPGTFVPMFEKPRCGRQSANIGWVVAENGCHLWRGACARGGYGKVQMDGRAQQAHRVRYEREVGPVPEGMVLDHFACDNPQCCNPEHVRPVTQRENVLRGDTLTARHAAKTHCKRGHPLSGDNVYVIPRKGARCCRACRKIRTTALRTRRPKTITPPEMR